MNFPSKLRNKSFLHFLLPLQSPIPDNMAGGGDFKTICGKAIGNIVVKENTQFNDILADNVTIERNVTTRFYGSVKGLLTLKGWFSIISSWKTIWKCSK